MSEESVTGPAHEPAPGRPVPTSDDLVALLPQQPPFRFVDAVDECRPGEFARARWRVTGDEEFFAGHFPGNPVVPGVLQLEALAQTGSVALLTDPRHAGSLPLFGGVERARFRRLVRPGEEVTLAFTIERLSSRGGWGSGRATVAREMCCDARLMFVLARR